MLSITLPNGARLKGTYRAISTLVRSGKGATKLNSELRAELARIRSTRGR